MDDFDVWSQQPSDMRAYSVAPARGPDVQPRQPAAVLQLEKPAAARCGTQLAPLTLEAYLQLHGMLTRGSQTVQQALPMDASKIKVQFLKQVPTFNQRNAPSVRHCAEMPCLCTIKSHLSCSDE